ncbi:MAG TPA: aldo/keto reductase [Terriglobia bacterium]|jgi:aryl-alcohol dehydrogenase-like predicted oxidoreductase|nr:aldo/keto reductase [Terriglobia bacterium]
MEFRTLPNTDLRVSRISFGTMTFGSQTDEDAARRMIDLCFDHEINFFDTANIYNKGMAETIVGKLLKGRRDKVVLATKVRGKMGDGPDDSGLSRTAIHKAIDASLRRLQTDYVDIYYMHQPDYEVPIEETLAAMDELVRAGKVRYPAVSNYAAWQVAEIHCISQKNGYKPPFISQPMYNLLARAIEDEYLPFCRRFGVAVVPYNPLAGGLLTGKQTREKPIAGTRFDGNKMYLDRYWHADYFDAVEDLKKIANDSQMTLIELALRWLLSQEQVDSVILGASRPEHLEQNLKACEGPRLGHDVLERCDAVWKRLRGVTPKYNR